jgi:uncharacterized protein YbaP (TraB family)
MQSRDHPCTMADTMVETPKWGPSVKARHLAWRMQALAASTLLALLLLVATASAREAAPAPAIWKIDGERGDIVFFGSIHILPPTLAWQTPELEAALNAAQKLHFEIDLDEAQNPAIMGDLINRYGFLPAGTTLRSLIAVEYRGKLERFSRSVGLPIEALDRMRPWLAAITLTSIQAAKQMSGGSPSPNPAETGGVDAKLWNWAKANGKQRGALETAESQIQLFANLTREQELQFLVVTLQQSEQANAIISQLLDAWKAGKVRKLDDILNRDMDKFPVLRKALFDDRHANWMPQIEALIRDGGDHVIVVGAAHLVGKGSIIDLLRARGVRVEGP